MIESGNKCRICCSSSLENISIGETRLIHCVDCDIHYSESFSAPDNIADYYKKSYEITTADIADIEFRRLFRSTEQLELISTIMDHHKPPASLLDIGCDKGFFIDQARRFGYTCKGVELSENAVAYAKNTGLDVCDGTDKLDQKYDVAVMWHSLEHFTEPLAYLQELTAHLNPSAHLFIRVPAFDSLWSKILGRKWIWFQPQNHYFHYSIKSLETLLNRAGYSVEIIEHRKPNNCSTRKQFHIARKIMSKKFHYDLPMRKRLIRIYEDWIAMEIFAVAKIKEDLS
jgi:2-polyprenyl-3-methyl-5-hydroxy-6-metoxy-1,4-benzoquinol methylase